MAARRQSRSTAIPWRAVLPGCGPAKILVETRLSPDAGFVEVSIDDNGPGIPVERREAVFAEGVSFRPEGTGLGLALVREVAVEDLGGSVRVDDSALGGARFVLRIPIAGAKTS